MKRNKFSPVKFLLLVGLGITIIGSVMYFIQFTPMSIDFDPRLPGLYVILAGVVLSHYHRWCTWNGACKTVVEQSWKSGSYQSTGCII